MKEVAYHIIAWGFPAVLTFLAAYDQVLGGVDGGGSWCALHGRNPSSPRTQWNVFYYPMLGVIVISSASILAVIVSLIRSANRTNKRGSSWRQYIRSLLFFCMFFTIFIFIYLYRVYAEVEEEYVTYVAPIHLTLSIPYPYDTDIVIHAMVK
jgi:hypothetical protein